MLDKEHYRLPSEAEWEAAARGRGAWRRYAWSGAFDPLRANTAETRLEVITPVGVFPSGVTPESGLFDICGNVWEWTGTPWSEGEAWDSTLGPTAGEPDARRVVRGGSWSNTASQARVGYRKNFDPDDRDFNVGFRLCRAAPILIRLPMVACAVCRRQVHGVARCRCTSKNTTRLRFGVAAQRV